MNRKNSKDYYKNTNYKLNNKFNIATNNNKLNKKYFFKRIFLFFLNLLLILFLFISLFLFLLFKYYSKDLPSIDEILNSPSNKVNILYSDSNNIIKTYSDSDIDGINFSEIPDNLIKALISTEDRNFFIHNGIDYFGIIRAVFINVKSGYIKQGGSTITQQLSKMILNDNSKTFSRKFKELILTRKIERFLTKENIISLYLSRAYFGAGNYGVKDASNFYFNKNLSDLTLEECAMLVGLLKAPSKFNPINNIDLTKNRTIQIIMNMQDAGFLDKNDILSYTIPDLNFLNNKHIYNNQNYFFTDWVYSKLPEYGLNYKNMSVTTTLDYIVQNIVIDEVNLFSENYNLGKTELAVIVMDRKGGIISMLGGKDYKKSQFNRAVYARRQTGSLFKLFTYLTALENNIKISDIFIDEPIKVANWYPENNNSKYLGNITLADAFAYSSNSVAVQIADILGIKNIIKTANKLGIVDDFRKDLTISLGSQESTLLDMVAAYSTIVNDGFLVTPYFIENVKSGENLIYKKNFHRTKPLFSKDTINNMKYLLFNVINSGTGKMAKIDDLINKTNSYNYSNNDINFFIGGKTGTNQSYKDAWFIGFVNDYIIGIWMGNDDNTPTNKITGGGLPAILWKNIALNFVY